MLSAIMNHMNITLASTEKTTILKALEKEGITFRTSLCGGRGTCGKCKVHLTEQNQEALACQTEFQGTINIELPDSGEEKICTEFGKDVSFTPDSSRKDQYGMAVDIGTTTVVMMMIKLDTAEILGFEAQVNSQAIHGADVISRITFATESPNGTAVLANLIRTQLSLMAANLCHRFSINANSVTDMVIAANTTMLHLLVEEDTKGIAIAPFTPVFINPRHLSGAELNMGQFPDMKVTLLGSISSYVGADITAGLYCTHIVEQPEPALFLDLGTNGEMGLWTGSEMICCSTAAGPVFEGASIKCGTASIPGAINHVKKNGITTIEDKPAIGICGSGVIDTMAFLLDIEEVDETGFLEKPFSLTEHFHLHFKEDVIFHPKDVREVQLAKSAIFSGIQTLLWEAGLLETDLRHVYLAGGFGTYLDPSSAMRIGLLSEKWSSIIKSAGNTSLKGAMMALVDPSCMSAMESMRQKARYLELSGMKKFQDLFVENMMFE